MIERLPGAVGGGYHGDLWVDDIAFERRPRITVAAETPAAAARSIPVSYTGLFDKLHLTDAEFDASLGGAIDEIYQGSTRKIAVPA